MAELKVGLVGEKTVKVDHANVAAAIGSGGVPVFATPAMVALIEGAAFEAVNPFLDAGLTTVGTLVNVTHNAATPVGMAVTARAELVEIDGRRLVFQVQVRDDQEVVGQGRHERFIVKEEKFLSRANEKINS